MCIIMWDTTRAALRALVTGLLLASVCLNLDMWRCARRIATKRHATSHNSAQFYIRMLLTTAPALWRAAYAKPVSIVLRAPWGVVN